MAQLTDMSSRILIIDYGSQYTQLIARRVREARVYSEIHPPTRSLEWVREWKPTGIILSGGPNSVYDAGAPSVDPAVLELAPVLGVCYGMNLLAHLHGGTIEPAQHREYGRAEIEVTEAAGLFEGFAPGERTNVWMSHGDQVRALPDAFVPIARTANSPIAAFRHRERPIYAVQFHPEVAHSVRGSELVANFLFNVCHATPDWTPGAFVEEEVRRISPPCVVWCTSGWNWIPQMRRSSDSKATAGALRVLAQSTKSGGSSPTLSPWLIQTGMPAPAAMPKPANSLSRRAVSAFASAPVPAPASATTRISAGPYSRRPECGSTRPPS